MDADNPKKKQKLSPPKNTNKNKSEQLNDSKDEVLKVKVEPNTIETNHEKDVKVKTEATLSPEVKKELPEIKKEAEETPKQEKVQPLRMLMEKTKTENVDVNYDPSKEKYDPINDAIWKKGEK